jgi:uncharacterized phage protein (TIGR01671 family)
VREIKFRAWDKVVKAMAGDNMVRNNFMWVSQTENFILMQYTGLKDKNGNEIYEGDIVKGHYWMNGKTDNRIIGEIEYVGCCFLVTGINQYKGLREELNSIFEVIGNIYENPELLKG